jgi:predicted Zn-dependent peptidase
MAEKDLRRDRAARLVVEPLPEDDVDKTSSSSGYIGASAGDDVARTSDDMSKVTKEEIAGARVSIDTKDIVDTTLSNGLRVVVLPHGNVPLVQASLVFGGGSSTLRQGEFEFATSNIIGAGTDPLQVAGQVNWVFIPGFAGLFPSESYPAVTGAQWSNAWRMDFAAPSGNLDSALWNMRTELDTMKPYLDGAGMWKSKLEKRLKGNWGDKSWHMSHIASEHLYPNAPGHQGWTWDEVQTAEDFNGSTVSDFIASHVDPTNATLVIAGNVDAKTAVGLAQGHFGDWQGKDAAKPGWQGKLTMPEMPTAPFRVIIEDDPKKTQTQTDMTCRLNTVDERDRPAVAVLGSLLFNQVFTQLRVKEALSYTPVAYAGMSDDNSATLTFSSLALNKGIGRTLQFFMEAAKAVEGGTFDREELTLHKLRMARESGLNSQSIGQVVDTLTGPIRRGEGWERISGAGWDIANVDDATLIRLIQGCTEHAIVTMTGPKDVIAEQLDGLGIAYEVIDADKLELELLQKYDEKAYEAKLKAKAKADKKKAKEDAKKKTEEAAPTEAAPADGAAPAGGDAPAPAPSGGDAAPQVIRSARDDEG